MIVAVFSENPNQPAHLWTFENFKEHHSATVLDFNTNGNIIEQIIYEIPQEVDYEYLTDLGLKCMIIEK